MVKNSKSRFPTVEKIEVMEGLLEMRSRRKLCYVKYQRSQVEDRLSGKIGSSGQTAEIEAEWFRWSSLGKHTVNMVLWKKWLLQKLNGQGEEGLPQTQISSRLTRVWGGRKHRKGAVSSNASAS